MLLWIKEMLKKELFKNSSWKEFILKLIFNVFNKNKNFEWKLLQLNRGVIWLAYLETNFNEIFFQNEATRIHVWMI